MKNLIIAFTTLFLLIGCSTRSNWLIISPDHTEKLQWNLTGVIGDRAALKNANYGVLAITQEYPIEIAPHYTHNSFLEFYKRNIEIDRQCGQNPRHVIQVHKDIPEGFLIKRYEEQSNTSNWYIYTPTPSSNIIISRGINLVFVPPWETLEKISWNDDNANQNTINCTNEK